MRKYLLLIAIPAMLIGCGQAEKEQLQAEVQRLQEQSSQKDADIDSFITSLSNIQENLDSIKTLEGIVTVKTMGEGKNTTAEEEILDDMRSIYDKMRKNREQLTALERSMKESSIASEKLTRLITKLKAELADKDTEIAVLRDKLARADIYIDELMTGIDQLALEGERKDEMIQTKDQILSAQETELLTAYWVKGSRKELIERGIIDREGAFLGMGGVKKVAGDLPHEDLLRINIYEATEFPVDARKVDIVSAHPSGSYELVGERPVERLVVTDPDDFWKNSKVLVIVTN